MSDFFPSIPSETSHGESCSESHTGAQAEPSISVAAKPVSDPACEQVPPAFYPLQGEARPATHQGRPQDATGDAGGWIKHPPRKPVVVLLQPEEKIVELPKAKTARAVLQAFGLRECTALVIREGELLTPDRNVAAGDRLTVRKVTSSG